MSYLIDTQIFLWWLEDDKRLSQKSRAIIDEQSIECFFSAASIWEISIKSALGKLAKIQDISKVIQEEGFALISITPGQAERVFSLPLLHKDPFDRLLITQAKDLKLKFLTSDKILKEYGNFVVVN